MVSALKKSAVPTLRALGFRGSFPHFYRDRDGQLDLITFQFSRNGGQFVAELSFATPDRSNLPKPFRALPPSQLRSFHSMRRKRLGGSGHGDHWFVYASSNDSSRLAASPEEIAACCAELLRTEGESWWRSVRADS